MASPSSVLTFGYGSWGSVNLLPTLGYGIGIAVQRRAKGGELWIGPRVRGSFRACPTVDGDFSAHPTFTGVVRIGTDS